ncbi:MAG: Ig-like domain-containing protein [Chloroflexota bacterium]
MTKRAVPLRTVVVLAIGVAVLGAILYYASTVDGRGPSVVAITLTQHLSGDEGQALTTTSVEVDFSEPVQRASAEAAFAINPSVNGAFSWSATSLTFTPAARLPLRTSFEVTVQPGVLDRVGNAMTGTPERFEFETVGNPQVVASEPMDAAEEVPIDAPIVLTFSTLMDTASVEGAIRVSPSTEVAMRWRREQLTIVPDAPWEPGRRYTLTIGSGARDQTGTALERPVILSFRAVAPGLTVEALIPRDGVAGISIFSPIALVLDQALDVESVDDEMLTIEPAVAGSLDVVAAPGAAGLRDPAPRILRFQPSGPLDPNTTYEVTLRPGLLGADGAGMPAWVSWTFTTGAPTMTLSNQVVFLSDRAGIANLWAMNPDGSNQRQLSAELSPATSYAVSPDGRAFIVGDGAAIIWQRADGIARRLLTDPAVVEFDAAFSPDGSLISFGRADPLLGSGLGLWQRNADGSDPRRIELPSAASASPSAGEPTPAALLRAPRMSPDGTAVAYIDGAGRVAILDLELQKLASAGFSALSAPIWLPDSSGILLAGLGAGSRVDAHYQPHSAVAVLDPASASLGPAELAALRIVLIDRSATAVRVTAFGDGAARPAVDAGGRYAYIRLEASDADAGSLWVTHTLSDAGEAMVVAPGGGASSVSFAPEPGSMVVGEAEPGGVWLVDLATGHAQQLANDGWLPRWLP